MVKFLLVLLIAASALLAGCAGAAQSAAPSPAQSPQPQASPPPLPPAPDNTATPPAPPSEGNSGIASAELAAHNTDIDCWVAYQGKVYDITSFLPVHKGGPAKIVPTCGTAAEFAAAFEAKHGTSKAGVLESQGVLKGDFAGYSKPAK